MSDDKALERERYDRRAHDMIRDGSGQEYKNGGGQGLAAALRAPYIAYEALLKAHVSPNTFALEVGAGTGAFTGVLLRGGASVCATDISPKSLEVLTRRHQGVGRLETRVADMECLPFPDGTFDLVASAGALSYGDNTRVMDEVFRVLKPGGVFLCVDSLNHNPLYRFNRWVHFLRGNRTRSTLQRMATVSLIDRYAARFGWGETQYFGAVSWLMPAVARVTGGDMAARASDWLDRAIKVRKSAFKFVMMVRKTRKTSDEREQ